MTGWVARGGKRNNASRWYSADVRHHAIEMGRHQNSIRRLSAIDLLSALWGNASEGRKRRKGRRGRESRPVKCAINKTREPEVERLSTDSLPCPTSWCRRDTSSCFQGEMYHKDKGGKKKQKWMTSDLEKANAVNAVHLCMAVLCVFFFCCFIGTHALEAQFVTTLRKWSLFSHS